MVWIGMIIRSFRVGDWTVRGQLVCTHVGFILLNMATMPFWMIEGLIFYGLLCGYTLAITSREAAPAPMHAHRRFVRPRARAPTPIEITLPPSMMAPAALEPET
jgi:hypothetical protein